MEADAAAATMSEAIKSGSRKTGSHPSNTGQARKARAGNRTAHIHERRQPAVVASAQKQRSAIPFRSAH